MSAPVRFRGARGKPPGWVVYFETVGDVAADVVSWHDQQADAVAACDRKQTQFLRYNPGATVCRYGVAELRAGGAR